MTELFISYCRRNKGFTEDFIKTLGEHGYSEDKIWIDWNNIPPSSKWEDEIRKGIEAANAVIFILSPDWILSNECAKELQIAVEYNKRLLPVIHQNIDPKTTPADLASLNWIFHRETDDPKGAMQKLLEALKTDLEWVSQHTVILKRANEWKEKAQDNSYLLRGSELQESELWLSKSSEGKEPRPNPVQNEYIFASRQDATRRQRNTLIGVSAALVVSILLAIAAVIGGIEAVRKSQQALASQLAAQAITLVDTQPDLALLLSLESNYISDTMDESDPARLGSLITSMNSMPKLEMYLHGHEGEIRTVTFSPDDHWMASTGNASNDVGQVFLWDMTSTTNPRTHQIFTGGSQRILGLAFSANSKVLAGAGDEKKVFIWDPQHCCEPVQVWEMDKKVRALEFIPLFGHEYLAIASGTQLTFWDIKTGKMNPKLTLEIPTEDPTVRIYSIAFSPAKNLIAVGGDDGNITVWDARSRTMKFHACSYGDPKKNSETVCKSSGAGVVEIRGVAFNTSGTLLASGSSDHRVWLWDTSTGELLAQSISGVEGGHINSVTNLAFDPITGEIASVSWDNTVCLWQPVITNNGNWQLNLVETLTGHTNSVWAVAYNSSGDWLATGSSDKSVILWDPRQNSQIGTPIKTMEDDTWAMSVSPDGKQFSAADMAGNIYLWDFDGTTLSNERHVMHEGGVLSLDYSHNSKLLASSGYTDSSIRVWDAQTGEEVWHIENAHDSEIWALTFSPDDTQIASASFDQTVKIWDVATQTLISEPLKHETGVFTLTYNEDGSKLFVGGFATDIYSYDLTDIKNIPSPKVLLGHASAVNLIAINPKYPNLLASTSDDKTLLIWNVTNNEHTPQVLGLNESMEAVNFRPSGDWLASATDNNTVLLWQLDSKRCSKEWDKNGCQPQMIGSPLTGSETPVENVVFLSDTVMVSSSEGGQLIQWNLKKEDWYQQACSIVNRPLSDSEYKQYVGEDINSSLLNLVSKVSNWFNNETPDTIPPCLITSEPE
jgi:WD40 repeat protein